MRNKKGFLLAEETLKIVIAVICIGFLAGFLLKLYFNHQNNEKLELAKASLEYLVSELNSGVDEVSIYNPKGWKISSWGTGGNMPLSCSNFGWENCICICSPSLLTFKDYKECDKMGTCLESGFNVDGTINIHPPLVLKIKGDTISK